MTSEKIITQKFPYSVSVEKNKNYAWCQCGRSKTQPFCDGSHKGTEFKPILYKARETAEIYFCGCKKTSNKPLCDGSHIKM